MIIYIVEECRSGSWIPSSPDNGDDVVGSIDKDEAEDLASAMEQTLGMSMRVREYQPV